MDLTGRLGKTVGLLITSLCVFDFMQCLVAGQSRVYQNGIRCAIIIQLFLHISTAVSINIDQNNNAFNK